MTRDCPDNPISRQLLSGILWNVFSSGSRQASFKRSSLSLSITILDQARLYTYNAAMLADRNKPITAEAALAKVIAEDGGNRICQSALNIFGGYGLTKDFPIERFERDSFFPMIGGGTRDILGLIAASQFGL
jgi:alkylation response protein AidB-like acyl-CoA dehydrogenase